MKIITQGSLNTFGDFFVSTHIMYNFHRQGHEVNVALHRNGIKESTLELYKRVGFFSSVFLMGDEEWERFPEYCYERGYEPHKYLSSIPIEGGMRFYNLRHWFNLNGCEKAVDFDNYIIVQVASSSNYKRPKIPCLDKWVSQIEQAQMIPLFIGTKADEELFCSSYSEISEKYKGQECWRFGKDSIWQSMGNVINAKAALVFSSWSSIIASLVGIYTIEMWSHEQVLTYGSVIKYYIGSPVSLIQIPFTYEPVYNYFNHPVKFEMDMRSLAWLQ